jgi:hypothetical protein
MDRPMKGERAARVDPWPTLPALGAAMDIAAMRGLPPVVQGSSLPRACESMPESSYGTSVVKR